MSRDIRMMPRGHVCEKILMGRRGRKAGGRQ